MKRPSHVLCCMLLLYGLGVDCAAAKSITVNVTAHVTQWADSTGVLGGQIAVGQAIAGTYTYDTNTPDQDPSTDGHYQPAATQAGVSVSAGALSFQSVATSQLDIFVHPSASPGNDASLLSIAGSNDQPLPSGALVTSIAFHFSDPTGSALTSDALPTDAPAIQNLSPGEIRIMGSPVAADFEIVAQIDTAQLAPPSMEISPATGSFLPQQRFDAALLLPVGAQIASMQASVGGSPLPLNYPGSCQLAPPNSSGRPAILCPDAYTVLNLLGAATQIQWQVGLADGTLLNQTVDWKLIQ